MPQNSLGRRKTAKFRSPLTSTARSSAPTCCGNRSRAGCGKIRLSIFQILFWWVRGRALLKQKLATRVQINPADLPYNTKFLAWLHEEKKTGRKLVLATASDLKMAQPIADHVGIFDEMLASNGKTNLRSENKLEARYVEKFGERGFDYAGNSSADFAVWRGSREAVIVNASRAVLTQAANCAKLARFLRNYSRLKFREKFWQRTFLGAAVISLPRSPDCCSRAHFLN